MCQKTPKSNKPSLGSECKAKESPCTSSDEGNKGNILLQLPPRILLQLAPPVTVIVIPKQYLIEVRELVKTVCPLYADKQFKA